MFDAFHDVEAKAKAGNENAQSVMQSWADAEWFTNRETLPEKNVMGFHGLSLLGDFDYMVMGATEC